MNKSGRSAWCRNAELSDPADSGSTKEAPPCRVFSYCVKDVSGRIHLEGTIPATRIDLDRWMQTLPQPWTAAMEATIF